MESKPVSLFSAGPWLPGVSCSCHQYSQLECGFWGLGVGEGGLPMSLSLSGCGEQACISVFSRSLAAWSVLLLSSV